MRAIGMTEFGGPEVLRELSLDPQQLGPGQVRIRVTAATVNPTDTVRRTGAYSVHDTPEGRGEVPGMDVAGVVTEVAGDATFAVGDRVMGIVVPAGEHGAYRSDIVLPVGSVARVPAGVSDAAAATLPMNGLTAMLALDRMGLEPGQTLAVTGAAGAFGGYVVQLAKARGLRVVADSSEADEELVRGLGADLVVRRGEDVASAILDVAPGGVDGLADGSVQRDASLPAVRPGGTMVTVRGWAPEETGDSRVVPIRVADVAERHEWLDELRQHVESGAVTLRVAGEIPAAEAAQAHRLLEAGGVRGRWVLTF